MGQANSRSRPAPYPLPQQDPSPSNPLSQPVHRGRTDSGATTASASSKNSRSSSFRRSVRSLLPHSRPTQDHSAPRHSPSSIRKRWRSSRYSNSPATLQDLPESTNDDDPLPFPSSLSPDAHHLIPEEHLTSNPSSAELAHSPISPTPYPPIPIPSAGPSTTHHSLYPSELSLSDHPTHADLPDFLDPPRPPQVDQLSGHIGTEHADQIERDLDDFLSHTHDKPFVQGSSRDGQSPPPLLDPVMPAQSISEPSSSDSPPQLPRHFQPPGPLVVVQGVVNTSDNPAIPQSSSASRSTRTNSINPSTAPSISLPRSSSNPRSGSNSEERQSARSRLSAFIPRTSTMLNRRSPTPDPNSVPTSESGFTTDASSTLQDPSTYDVLSSDEDTPPTSDAEQRSSQDSDIRPRPLSPGSIDVLGTLLSVAAAATAASLFSPSLGYQANADSNGLPPSGIPRPMSPTPTAGLGGGEGFRSLPGFGLDPVAPQPPALTPIHTPQPREGRERIRNVWESFRERLGLNRNSPPNSTEETQANNEEQGNMRPGEIMLAEMARALNIGLGLNGDGSGTMGHNSDPQSSANGETRSDSIPTGRPVSPEDSFERFLLNLQADLRVALSEDGISTGSTLTPLRNEQQLRGRSTDDTASARLPFFNELPMRVDDDEDDDNHDDEPPPLEDVSDSEDEDADEDDIYEDTVSTRTPTPMPASTTVHPNRVDYGAPGDSTREEHGTADRGPPGINLWRLYRFQPIPASQVAGHAAATTSPSIPLSPSVTTGFSPPALHDPDSPHQPPSAGSSPPSSSASAASPYPDPDANGADSTPAATSSSPPAGDASSNMVVPVIVVGLQSVDMGQAHGHAHPPESDAAQSDLRDIDRDGRHASASSFDESQYAPLDSSASSGAATPRGRGSWQSRAASALRNLRPGRRGGSGTNRAAEGTGSRTFLIYVIGGYYPPNHHMVTGSDNLDSYEALWELAELLGQVKPPVATREDIDKSGLQVIQSSELEEYERQGKVASNCVDRCLICLDDYAAEDELRLMACKHVFHRECVDRWLQVGRNNCPACRTRGVSTAGDLSSS